MFQKTITYSKLKHCDILFYRPRTFFGYLIGIFTAIMRGKFDRVTFSHVAIMLKDRRYPWTLKRFDAMEGKKTGFRVIGKAYVFRFKNLTQEQKNRMQKYWESREWSGYDRRGVFSIFIRFLFRHFSRLLSHFLPKVHEDEFLDYCCELIKNMAVYAGIMKDVEQIIPFDLYKKNREKMDFIWLIL